MSDRKPAPRELADLVLQGPQPWHLDDARAELRAALQRDDQLLNLRREGRASRGHCDDCHAEPVGVWEDPLYPDQGWQYCAPCIQRRHLRCVRRMQIAIEKCKAAGGVRCQRCGDFHRKGISCDCYDYSTTGGGA